MGYDITFHPFSRKEYKFFVEAVVENPDDFKKQLEYIHSDQGERDFLAQNVYGHVKRFKEEVLSGTVEYEKTIGLVSGAILGYLHPYWYSRGGLLTELLNEEECRKFFARISGIIDERNKPVFDKARNFITGNYSSGGFIPHQNITPLKEFLTKDSSKEIVDKYIGNTNIESLLKALEYCETHGLDLLEVSDIYVPFTGETSTYPENFRASHLENIDNFKNDSMKSELT